MHSHASDVTPIDFRRVIEALEESIDSDGVLTIHDENGVPVLTLSDATVHETGAVGWVE